MRLPTTFLIALLLLGALQGPALGGEDPVETGDEALARARALYTSGGPTAALTAYHEALALYRDSGNELGEAITLGLIGNCHKRLGNYDQALDLLGRALTKKRQLGNRLEEGKTLTHLGLVYWELADYDTATELLEQAIDIGEEIEDPRLLGAALNNLSLVYDEQGDYRRSIEQYERALEIFRRQDAREAESYVLGNIGGVYLLLGRYREAMRYYEQAFEISAELDAKPSMSQDLGNLATCHRGRGEIPQALEKLDRALLLAREAGLAKEEADWLKGKGDVLLDTGRHSEGLELYEQAVNTYKSAGLQRELADALNELATLHLELGDLITAHEDLQQALGVAETIGFHRGVLTNLIDLGELEWRRERFSAAADYLKRALALATEEDRDLASTCFTQLAFNSRDRGDFDRALQEALQGLDLAQSLDSPLRQAEALHAVGELELGNGKPAAALARFEEGGHLVQGLGEPDIAWRLAYARGRALEALERPEEALDAYKKSVQMIETVRGRLQQERFRAGYIEDKQDVYMDLVRLLVVLEQPGEAFGYAEKLRARSYIDLLGEPHASGLSEAQRQRENELRQRVRRLRLSLEQELEPSYEPRRQAVALFAEELDEAERAYESFLSDFETVEPALAATWTLAVPPVAAIQQQLGEDDLLLEFVVGRDEVLIFGLTHDRIVTHTALLSRRDLRAKVELMRELIRRRDSTEWQYPGASLAGFLIEPLAEAGWLRGVRHLYVVPHDSLHYLPFAALPRSEGKSLLVEDYSITHLPAAGSLVLGTGPATNPGRLLALAPENARLRHTAAEVRSIAEVYPDDANVLIGPAASEHAFKTLASQYGVLHLATHNEWNRLNPLLTALELEAGDGEDGRLEVHEILDLDLVSPLVTLSGCETALGSGYRGTTPIGDDFVGLTRAFLHAGSRTVMASLWEVDDRATVEMMTRFYNSMRASHSPALALAATQRSMLRDNPSLEPFLWAPFVVIGSVPRGDGLMAAQKVSVQGK